MKPPANGCDVVAVLLEDDDIDPKDFVYAALPSAVDAAWQEVERRTRQRIENACVDAKGVYHKGGEWLGDHVHDIAVEVAGEVACERGLDKNDAFMWKLMSMASRFRL